MASNSVKYGAGGFTSEPLKAVDSASLRITNADSYIFGGWIKLPIGAGNISSNFIMAKGGNTTSTKSYMFDMTGNGTNCAARFFGRDSSSSVVSISSTPRVNDGVAAFILGWVDVGAGTINVQINNGAVDSSSISLSSFTDPGGNLDGFRAEDGFGSSRHSMDEWFFCKNPPDMSAALAAISTYVYNNGFGVQYSFLSAALKTQIGLVSWWGFDELLGTRFDLHGNNDFAINGDVENDTSLVSGSILYSTLSDSAAMSDSEDSLTSFTRTFVDALTDTDLLIKEFEKAPILESLAMMDARTTLLNKVFGDVLFLGDGVRLSPFLRALPEQIRFNDWLMIERRTPELWHD